MYRQVKPLHSLPFNKTPQIAVSKHTHQFAVVIDDRSCAIALAGYLKKRIPDQCGFLCHREFISGPHKIPYPQEKFFAKRSARVEEGKILFPQTEEESRHSSNSITEGHLERRAACRGKTEGIGFRFNVAVQNNVSLPRKCGGVVSGHCYYRCPQPFKIWDYVNKFPGLAAVAQEIAQIFTADHAEVPVGPFRCMEKKGRDPQRCECCCSLPSDMPRLAQAGHHYPSLAAAKKVRRRNKLVADP